MDHGPRAGRRCSQAAVTARSQSRHVDRRGQPPAPFSARTVAGRTGRGFQEAGGGAPAVGLVTGSVSELTKRCQPGRGRRGEGGGARGGCPARWSPCRRGGRILRPVRVDDRGIPAWPKLARIGWFAARRSRGGELFGLNWLARSLARSRCPRCRSGGRGAVARARRGRPWPRRRTRVALDADLAPIVAEAVFSRDRGVLAGDVDRRRPPMVVLVFPVRRRGLRRPGRPGQTSAGPRHLVPDPPGFMIS